MILGGDFYIVQETFNRDSKISDISITLPEDLQYDEDLYKYVDGIPLDKCKIVPFNDIKEEDIYYSQPEDDYNSPQPSSLYFLYKIDKLSDTFHGTKRSINYLGSPGSTQLSIADYVFFIEYNGEYYFLSAYSGD